MESGLGEENKLFRTQVGHKKGRGQQHQTKILRSATTNMPFRTQVGQGDIKQALQNTGRTVGRMRGVFLVLLPLLCVACCAVIIT